jgi:hypothetical protein
MEIKDILDYCIIPYLDKHSLGAFARVSQEYNGILRGNSIYLEFLHHWKTGITFVQACSDGHLHIAKYLCNAESDLEKALRCACRNNRPEVVEYLCGLGVLDCIFDKESMIIACVKGHLGIVEYLIKHDILLGESEKFLDRILLEACESGCLELVKLLVKLGANVQTSKELPLHIACHFCHFELAKWLVGAGATTTGRDREEIFHICRRKNIEMFKWIMNIVDHVCLSSCVDFEEHAIELAEWLLNSNFKLIEDVDEIFRKACNTDNVELIKWAINKWPNISLDIDEHFANACFGGRVNIINWLYCFDQIAEDTIIEGFTWACLYGHIDIAKWLFYDIGVDIRKTDRFVFEMYGHNTIVDWLTYRSYWHIHPGLYFRDTHNSELETLRWVKSVEKTSS